MKVKAFIVGMYETNSFIIYDENTLHACIIDPGDDSKSIINFIDKTRLILKGIILTHYHYDHIGAVMELKKKYSSLIYCHKKDVEGLNNPIINGSKIGLGKEILIIPDKLLADGDTIVLGDLVLQVIHTPGHTPGSICINVKGENMVFTGDTLFSDDLGRTDLQGGNEQLLRKSIINKIDKWPDDLFIYPGHGEGTSMKNIRRRNIPYIITCKKR